MATIDLDDKDPEEEAHEHNHENCDEDDSDEESEEEYNREDRVKCAKVYNKSIWKNVFRSKGMIYLATQAQTVFTVQTAGMMCEVKATGRWLASGTKQELIKEGYKKEYDSWKNKAQGDRITQLVIIGSDLDKQAISKCLDD